MTPVRVRGLQGVARDAEAVLVIEALAGGGVLAFRIPPGEAARVARVLGLAGCRRVPIYDLVRGLADALGGRVSGAVLDARPGGIAATIRVARQETGDRGAPMPPGRRDCPRASGGGAHLRHRGGAPPEAAMHADRPGPERPDLADWLERVRPRTSQRPHPEAKPEPREVSTMRRLLVVTLAREAETDRAGVVLRTMDQALELVLMIPPAEAARLAQVLGLTPAPVGPSTGSSRTC